MILSDGLIKELISYRALVIEPLSETQIQPSSVDLTLGSTFLAIDNINVPFLDPKRKETIKYREVHIEKGGQLILQPGFFLLGTTTERLMLPNFLVARVEGRSSLGRMGILIHATAGYVDPGFCGQITLEISNVNNIPVALYPGMRICQVSFELLFENCVIPYGLKGKYQGQEGPEGTRIFLDFLKE